MFNKDVLERINKLPNVQEVRQVAIKDRLLKCRLKLHFIVSGSLDPLPKAILEHLPYDKNKGLSIDELSKRVGGIGEIGCRVTSEVLAVLKRVKEISVSDDGKLWYLSGKDKLKDEQVIENVIEENFQYLVRSKQFASKIPGFYKSRLEKLIVEDSLNFWKSNNVEEAPESDIINECAKYYKSKEVPNSSNQEEYRYEILQRCKLMAYATKFLGASVITTEPSEYWNVHRCFLYRFNTSESDDWNIEVYRYPRGPKEQGYTQYFRSEENIHLVNSLLDDSKEIKLSTNRITSCINRLNSRP